MSKTEFLEPLEAEKLKKQKCVQFCGTPCNMSMLCNMRRRCVVNVRNTDLRLKESYKTRIFELDVDTKEQDYTATREGKVVHCIMMKPWELILKQWDRYIKAVKWDHDASFLLRKHPNKKCPDEPGL